MICKPLSQHYFRMNADAQLKRRGEGTLVPIPFNKLTALDEDGSPAFINVTLYSDLDKMYLEYKANIEKYEKENNQ